MACTTHTLPDIMPDDDLTPMPIYCKTCKHWTREFISDWPNPSEPANVGRCLMAIKTTHYVSASAAQKQITDGRMGCENIYTNEHFGCIHYDRKF